jgi:hypothetical protein
VGECVTFRRATSLVIFYNLVIHSSKSRVEAAKLAAGRSIRKWDRVSEETKELPSSQLGAHGKAFSLLSLPEVASLNMKLETALEKLLRHQLTSGQLQFCFMMNRLFKPTMPRRSLGSWTYSTNSRRKGLVGAYIALTLSVRQEVGAKRGANKIWEES